MDIKLEKRWAYPVKFMPETPRIESLINHSTSFLAPLGIHKWGVTIYA